MARRDEGRERTPVNESIPITVVTATAKPEGQHFFLSTSKIDQLIQHYDTRRKQQQGKRDRDAGGQGWRCEGKY